VIYLETRDGCRCGIALAINASFAWGSGTDASTSFFGIIRWNLREVRGHVHRTYESQVRRVAPLNQRPETGT
jgi:hypothetical protein